MKLLTARQMRELDKLTIEREPVESIDLMERASRAAHDEIVRRWGVETRFVVFAGPGNNGGDALAIMRMLLEDGYDAEAYVFNIRGELSLDCDTNLQRLLALQANVHVVEKGFDFPKIPRGAVIIDGLFGTGLSRSLSGGFAAVVKAINACGLPVVSIDMPSGLMAEENTYNDMRNVVRARLTLTMHRAKISQILPENDAFVGELVVLPIDLHSPSEAEFEVDAYITEEDEVKQMLRKRSPFSHKGTVGHAMLLAGSRGMAGAAIMAAKACLRTGVGKVTVVTAPVNLPVLQVAVPEAVVKFATGAVPGDFAFGYQAFGIGPGMGDGEANTFMLHLLRSADGPLLLDADALTLIGSHSEWLNRIPAGSILTPHPREFDRIVGTCPDSWQRLQRARALAAERNIYILIKGHYSACVFPTGKVYFNPTGNAGMATAGSGDVLTGVITALLAQGYPSGEALRLGVYLHGLAGDIALDAVGAEESVVATDIINYIGKAFNTLRK